MESASILWQRLDRPGHEASRLVGKHAGEHRLSGTAVFLHGGDACCLRYRISCDRTWATRRALISGFVGERRIAIEIDADGAGAWRLGGVRQAQADGCLDIDLNFSPSTNLLPIRRLALDVSAEAPVRAAWLRFPSFALEPLEQTYRRIEDRVYRYSSAGGGFVRDLSVDGAGFVTTYPDYWRAVSSASSVK